ncbi:hypothetical protein [Halomonas sp. H5]|uniref:hypothetical protein n=1 Tax=Halomonas sp. H5 TaxID=3423910 RepID=UPI003D361E6B
MIAFTRLLVVVLVLLTLCYGIVNLYLYVRWRSQLKREWLERERQGRHDEFLRRGLRRCRRRWRPVLIGLIYVLPITALTLLVYIINFT